MSCPQGLGKSRLLHFRDYYYWSSPCAYSQKINMIVNVLWIRESSSTSNFYPCLVLFRPSLSKMKTLHFTENKNALSSVESRLLGGMSFNVKGPGAVILLFRLGYKTIVVCHNVYTQKVKIARRDRPHILASNRCETFENQNLIQHTVNSFCAYSCWICVRFIRYQYRMKVVTFSIAV